MSETCARGCCTGPNAQADHYRSVVVRPLVSAQSQREKAMSGDMAAYKRLRADGVQPKAIDGAAAIERDAGTKIEVESGHIIRNDRLRREMEQAQKNLPPPAA